MAGIETFSLVAAPAPTVVEAEPLTVLVTVSVAVTVCAPAVTRVATVVKTCTPLSVLVKV